MGFIFCIFPFNIKKVPILSEWEPFLIALHCHAVQRSRLSHEITKVLQIAP